MQDLPHRSKNLNSHDEWVYSGALVRYLPFHHGTHERRLVLLGERRGTGSNSAGLLHRSISPSRKVENKLYVRHTFESNKRDEEECTNNSRDRAKGRQFRDATRVTRRVL